MFKLNPSGCLHAACVQPSMTEKF